MKDHNAAPSFSFSNKSLLIWALLFSLFSLPATLFAKHIIGGEMTYKFIETLPDGKNRYEFTLVVFRDCNSSTNGANLDNPARIGIYSGNINAATFVQSLNANVESLEYIDPVIPSCADVSSVSGVCVQRGIYLFTLDLPPLQNQSYFIVYQRCCRTVQIVNIANPDQYGATYMVEITPQAQAMQNSSPSFANYPPTFICNNFPLNFDHSATDADGDSLVYSFCTPLTGGGQGGGNNNCTATAPNPPCGPPFGSVFFVGNYSQNNPMGGTPMISVNPQTGLLTGTPMLLGQYVVGICVREYRNGLYMGAVSRDFQFNVVDCTPTVIADVKNAKIIGPKHFLVKNCGGKTVTIYNNSPISPDLTTWDWVVQIDSTHQFTINTWNLTVTLPEYGEYTTWLYLNRNEICRDTAFITLQAFPGITADFDYSYDVCTETPVTFADSSSAEAAGGIVSWDWNFGQSVAGATLQNPVLQFPEYGTYATRLIVADGNDCRDTAAQLVVWQPHLPPVIPKLPVQEVCLPGLAAFPLLDSLVSTGDQVNWDFGDGRIAENETSPQHLYAQPGVYTVSVAVTTAYDCFVTDTFADRVHIYPSPTADFSYLPVTPSNLDNMVHFTDQSDPTAVVWDWQFGNA
ncbi:MAG: PKD domain-containing protein, partial [Saprospiraceae bacterium]